jgi:hypothetical protein
VVAEVIDVFRMRRDANPSRRQLVTLIIIIASAVCVALAGTRDAEIAAIKSRVEAKKAVGMVVATIEPDGSSSLAAFGNAGPGARPLDADSVFEIGSITKVPYVSGFERGRARSALHRVRRGVNRILSLDL